MKNAFTIDVEDYFHVAAFSDVIPVSTWDDYQQRVVRNSNQLLELLDYHQIHGTFFILGWVAKRYPELVRAIADAGHEVASHGMNHQLIYQQTPDVFREETRRSKRILEDICGEQVIGYRAATYSITRKSLWALDILSEEGFLYDSSIFPVYHDKYGIPDAKSAPHYIKTNAGNTIAEFPISVLKYGKFSIPIAGGGYFRLFPYLFTKWALSRLNRNNQSFVFYLHPWEIDPQQPIVADAKKLSRFRHYQNLHKCRTRLEMLMNDFDFVPLNHLMVEIGLLSREGKQYQITNIAF